MVSLVAILEFMQVLFILIDTSGMLGLPEHHFISAGAPQGAIW